MVIGPDQQVLRVAGFQHRYVAVADVRADGVVGQVEKADDAADHKLRTPANGNVAGGMIGIGGQDELGGVDQDHGARRGKIHTQQLGFAQDRRFVGERAVQQIVNKRVFDAVLIAVSRSVARRTRR